MDDGQTGMDIGLIQNGRGVFQDLRWFYLPYAKGDWAVQAGNPVFRRPTVESVNSTNPHPQMVGADSTIGLPTYGQTSVRVDTDRGVFYFLQAN
jgi:hypothetical protein